MKVPTNLIDITVKELEDGEKMEVHASLIYINRAENRIFIAKSAKNYPSPWVLKKENGQYYLYIKEVTVELEDRMKVTKTIPSGTQYIEVEYLGKITP